MEQPTDEMPRWVEPMLATLVDTAPSDPGWVYERKLDGQRCLAFADGDGIRLLSRNRKDQNATYPELVDALLRLDAASFIVDGEIVAFDETGRTSFSRLQHRMHIADQARARRSGVVVTYSLFDVLYLDGRDTRSLPLIERKGILHDAFTFTDPIRFTEHRSGDGVELFNEACGEGWEGLVAKETTAPYVPGRSQRWLKVKCLTERAVVIGGYTDPQGSRTGFGALLVGTYEGERLVYAGKVGTGFDEATLTAMTWAMDEMQLDDSPFGAGDPPTEGVHWVNPVLVAQVAFTEWTPAGRLRAPRFLGLRTDKGPLEITKELPS